LTKLNDKSMIWRLGDVLLSARESAIVGNRAGAIQPEMALAAGWQALWLFVQRLSEASIIRGLNRLSTGRIHEEDL
jgi:hypothetical protein